MIGSARTARPDDEGTMNPSRKNTMSRDSTKTGPLTWETTLADSYSKVSEIKPSLRM